MTRINNSKEFPWVTVFMDVALRAVREVHHTHGRWMVGRHWEMNPVRSAQINKGPGLALADERTVCSAISQEFLGSSAVAGFWEGKIRFFDIEREAPYISKSSHQKVQRVDLFIKKFVLDADSSQLEPVPRPAFVEAKRARLWYPDIDSTKRRSVLQVKKIRRDIAKLRGEKSYRKEIGKEEINTHILVWGVHSTDGIGDSPTEMLNRFGDGLSVRGIRSLPIDWDDADFTKPFTLPQLTSVLWLLLAEVDSDDGA